MGSGGTEASPLPLALAEQGPSPGSPVKGKSLPAQLWPKTGMDAGSGELEWGCYLSCPVVEGWGLQRMFWAPRPPSVLCSLPRRSPRGAGAGRVRRGAPFLPALVKRLSEPVI